MKQFVCLTAMSVLVTVPGSGYAQAATFAETGDAGELLSAAQVVPKELSPLKSISGTLSEITPDADLFKIFLIGGQRFSATTVGGADFDTQLFLFNSKGIGVYGNDNESDILGRNQSALPKAGFSPEKAGIYYLAISGFDYDPVSTGGEIFPDPNFPFNQVSGPAGPGGEAALSGFDGARLSGGSYTIALTGTKGVPEPSSALGILAFGTLGTAFWLKRKQSKRA